jgi:hypothetical protein
VTRAASSVIVRLGSLAVVLVAYRLRTIRAWRMSDARTSIASTS